MSFSLEVVPPFKVFHDRGSNPDPLEGGYIYIGEPGLDPETNPKGVFWDIARTISAAQPIRTIGGRPDRGGSPAAVYSDEDYSITVKNSAGELVYTSLYNYTNEINKYYYFDTVDALKAADTSQLIGERTVLYIANGSAQEDNARDYNGGMFLKTNGIGTPSIESFNSRGEYIVSDNQGVEFVCISKSPPGSFMGLHLIGEIDSKSGSGLITPDYQSEPLIGTYISPQSSLATLNPNFSYAKYFADPYHKNQTDYRVLNLSVFKDAGLVNGNEPFFRFSSEGYGAFSASANRLPIHFHVSNNGYIAIDYDNVYMQNARANQYRCDGVADGYSFYSGSASTQSGIRNGGSELNLYYKDPVHSGYNDIITITGNNGAKHSSNPLARFNAPIKHAINNLGFGNPGVDNRLDVSAADVFICTDGAGVTITHLDHGFKGQIVTFCADFGTITFNPGNTSGLSFPVTITNTGQSKQLVCIDSGDSTGQTSRWKWIS